MEKRLEGRIALITGASRGIGRAVAKRFAQEGAHPILIARTQAALEELDDEIRSETGIESTLIPLDLRDFDAIDKVGATSHRLYRWHRNLGDQEGSRSTRYPSRYEFHHPVLQAQPVCEQSVLGVHLLVQIVLPQRGQCLGMRR